MFKVNDKVWDFLYGYGEVISINSKGTFPIRVKFNHDIIDFTKDGSVVLKANRTLFFKEVPIPETALIRPNWRANKGKTFYFINIAGEVASYNDTGCEIDNKLFNSNNYFQTEEDAINSKFYKVFHDNEIVNN